MAVPVLSRLQHDVPRFVSSYRRIVMLMTSLCMPLAVLTAVSADKVILVVMGPHWEASVAMFRLLAPARSS